MNKVTTLNQFIIEQQAGVPQATGGFSCLLHHVGIAAKKVNREVNKAGLVDILGRAGSENVQGEDQQKLDIYANETFLSELKASGECCGVASDRNSRRRWPAAPRGRAGQRLGRCAQRYPGPGADPGARRLARPGLAADQRPDQQLRRRG